jgi:hypothetical protein
MSVYKGIPFNGGMDAPSGTGAQNIVETCKAVCDWLVFGGTSGQLKDATPTTSVNWLARTLNDTGGHVTADWFNCQLHDPSSTIATISWAACQLDDTDAVQSLDWITRETIDNANQLSMAWSDRHLVDVDGATIQLTWANGIFMPNLPTGDPHVSGQLWNNGGQMQVSAG